MRSDAFGHADSACALAQLTETGAAALRVERVSVWRFDETHDHIECLDLFERSSARHSSGQRSAAGVSPRYFHALSGERAVAVDDAHRDPRTSEFTAGYLLPNGITRDARRADLACGQAGGRRVPRARRYAARRGRPWEQLVAGTFADFASMILGARSSAPGRPRR